jgi:hypothetical protein
LVTVVLEEYTASIFRIYSENVESAYRVLIGKPEERSLLRKHRCIWVADIKFDFRE